MLKQLASDILEINPKLQFTLLEIGARGVHANPEPFYQIVDLFPGSTITGFEIDEELCHSMNKEAGRVTCLVFSSQILTCPDFFEPR